MATTRNNATITTNEAIYNARIQELAASFSTKEGLQRGLEEIRRQQREGSFDNNSELVWSLLLSIYRTGWDDVADNMLESVTAYNRKSLVWKMTEARCSKLESSLGVANNREDALAELVRCILDGSLYGNDETVDAHEASAVSRAGNFITFNGGKAGSSEIQKIYDLHVHKSGVIDEETGELVRKNRYVETVGLYNNNEEEEYCVADYHKRGFDTTSDSAEDEAVGQVFCDDYERFTSAIRDAVLKRIGEWVKRGKLTAGEVELFMNYCKETRNGNAVSLEEAKAAKTVLRMLYKGKDRMFNKAAERISDILVNNENMKLVFDTAKETWNQSKAKAKAGNICGCDIVVVSVGYAVL